MLVYVDLFFGLISEYLTDSKARVVADGCCSNFTDVKSEVFPSSVCGPFLFIPYDSDMWNGIASKMTDYALYLKVDLGCQ